MGVNGGPIHPHALCQTPPLEFTLGREPGDEEVAVAPPRTSWIEKHRQRYRVTWIDRGVRHRRSFITQDEARDFLRRLHQDERREKEPRRVSGGLTVMEVVQNWYRDHRLNLTSGTQRDYEGRIGRDVSRIGDLQAEALLGIPETFEPSTPR
jgi:hypothetical protein